MNSARTVTLELLRHGPAHNQLLSPLTQYLALCGNHSAATVTMPFEHAQLLNRLRALMYKATQEDRKFQLKDLSQIMGNVFGTVPGLIAELAELPGHDNSLTHLRLILSASELALLPFELANAPNGFPGAGQSLALQPQAPLCITREVRRVSNTAFQWPVEPRILFIAASPSGVGNIPLEAHLLALRKVIDPWVEYDIPSSEEKPEQDKENPKQDKENPKQDKLQEKLARHMVIIPKATVDSIQRPVLRETSRTSTFSPTGFRFQVKRKNVMVWRCTAIAILSKWMSWMEEGSRHCCGPIAVAATIDYRDLPL